MSTPPKIQGYFLVKKATKWAIIWATIKQKWPTDTCEPSSCGERGIRTPGGSHLNSFQDCRNRPLYHLSNRTAKICKYFLFFQEFLHKTPDLITLCHVQIISCQLYCVHCVPLRMQWPGSRKALFRQRRGCSIFANNQLCFRVHHRGI